MMKNQIISWVSLAALVSAGAAIGAQSNPQASPKAYMPVGEEAVTLNTSRTPMLRQAKATAATTEVCADNGSGMNKAMVANDGLFTRPSIYTNDFGTADAWNQMITLNLNNDDEVWEHNAGVEARILNLDHEDIDMDDWLITPAIDLEGGKTYRVRYNARCGMSKWPETMGVYAGTAPTPEALTIPVCEPYKLGLVGYQLYTGTFTAPSTGKYHVGYHGTSPGKTYSLLVDNIDIAEVIPTAAPNYVWDVNFQSDAAGELHGTLSFKAPAVNLDSVPLTGTMRIDVLRDGVKVKSFDNVAPGAECSFDDNVGVLGYVDYTISAFGAAGEGPRLYKKAHVGIDKPLAPENVTLTEEGNTGKVTLAWNAVTHDISGLAIPSGNVTYNICKLGYDGWEPLVSDLTGTSYTYQAVDPDDQNLLQLAVWAKTVSGLSEEESVSTMEFIGKPYTDFKESFANGEISTPVMYIPVSPNMEGGVATDETTDMRAADGDNGYAWIGSSGGVGTAAFGFGKVSLANLTNPVISFYTYNLAPNGGVKDDNTIDVYIYEAGNPEYARRHIGTVDSIASGIDGWARVAVPLDGYEGKDIHFTIAASSVAYVFTFLDCVKVESRPDHDLRAVKIEGPASAQTGRTFDLAVTIQNEGSQPATGHNLDIYLDGGKHLTVPCDTLLPNARQTLTVPVMMPPLAEGTAAFHAVAVHPQDGNPGNNASAVLQVNAVASPLASPSSLTAEGDMSGVSLAWDAPDYSAGVPESVTEDFESAEGWEHEFGDWTFVDRDDSAVGGIGGITLPGLQSGRAKAAFFLFDTDRNYGSAINAKVAPHEYGSKQLATMYLDNEEETDDWAISPVLSGNAQTITFWAKSYDPNWLETISVLYSTGSLNPDDFTATSVKSYEVPNAWTKVEVQLPAGARHFAVRSHSDVNFMLFLDDFTYERAYAADAQLQGYNVWASGEKINDTPVSGTQYTDTAPKRGSIYRVTAVYDYGESTGSNEADPQLGLANGDGTEQNPFTISNLDELNTFIQIARTESCEGLWFKQTADIDNNGVKYSLPVIANTFQGNYNGGGFTLRNLDMASTPKATYGGFFGTVGENGVVSNLTLEGAADITVAFQAPLVGTLKGTVKGITSKMDITTNQTYTSGIASEVVKGALMEDCEYTGTITASLSLTGGIAGRTNHATLRNCKFSGAIVVADNSKNRNWQGGIAAYAYPSAFINCENSGHMPADSLGMYRGGIVAHCYGQPNASNSGDFVFRNCVNNSNVKGSQYLGGIVGKFDMAGYTSANYMYKSTVSVDSCANTGNISASKNESNAAGIIGAYSHSTAVTACTNSGNVTTTGNGQLNIGGIVGSYMIQGTDSTTSVISGCVNTGEITALARDEWECSSVGGVAGMIGSWTIVAGCENRGAVNTTNTAGGIVGYMPLTSNNSKVLDCINYGDVTGVTHALGGIVGVSYENSYEIRGCTNLGNVYTPRTVAGDTNNTGTGVAGICGVFAGTASDNLNIGDVQGAEFVGGIAGRIKPGAFVNVYNCVNTGSLIARTQIDGQIVNNLDSVGAIIGVSLGNTEYWNPANATQSNNYWTASTYSAYGEVPGSALENRAGTGISDSALALTAALGEGWDRFGSYCWPVPAGTQPTDCLKVWSAQVVPMAGQDLDSISESFLVGVPEGLVWTAAPDCVTFDGNDAVLAADAEGTVVLTATCGAENKQVSINVLKVDGGADGIQACDIVEQAWYTPSGLRTSAPVKADGKVYIVVSRHADGRVTASKVINNKED